MRSTLLGLLALALTKSVLAAEPPTLEPASRTSPHASSLSDYRAWSEAPVGGGEPPMKVSSVQAARMQAMRHLPTPMGLCRRRAERRRRPQRGLLLAITIRSSPCAQPYPHDTSAPSRADRPGAWNAGPERLCQFLPGRRLRHRPGNDPRPYRCRCPMGQERRGPQGDRYV
jgi:hypothetical protein